MNKHYIRPHDEQLGISAKGLDKLLSGLLVVAVALAAILFAMGASAQAVPGSAALSWTLPTTSVDGVALTGTNALTGIEVYIATSPIADTSSAAPTLTLSGSATSATHTMQVTNGATLYARLKAVNASGKSAFSNQVSKVVQLSTTPGVPTSVTITLQIG